VARPEHLRRHVLADLFLDTFPYNAHTTASDALRCGLPLLTRAGRSFASRVSASLLQTLGLESLITHTPEAYAAMALAWARDSAMRCRVQKTLNHSLAHSPLFHAEGLRPSLEAAYAHMVQQQRQGLAPRAFDVTIGPQGAYCEVL
jgi:predicted O-linked N-acetylglucosamine transferase (SPINDLY family)